MWRRKRKRTRDQSAGSLDKKAEKLAVFIIQGQRKLADRLNKKAKGASKLVLQKWLIVYCLLTSLICLLIIYKALVN